MAPLDLTASLLTLLAAAVCAALVLLSLLALVAAKPVLLGFVDDVTTGGSPDASTVVQALGAVAALAACGTLWAVMLGVLA